MEWWYSVSDMYHFSLLKSIITCSNIDVLSRACTSSSVVFVINDIKVFFLLLWFGAVRLVEFWFGLNMWQTLIIFKISILHVDMRIHILHCGLLEIK